LKSKLEQLELDYGSIVDLHSRLKNGPPDEVAALVNRIRAEDFPDVRAPLDPGSITSDGYPDEPESSEDVASEANWDSYNTTSPAAYADMSRNPFPQEPFYNRMPDNIPIDPALAGLDPPVNQYTQPSPDNFDPPSMPMPIPFNQDPNINIFGFPISDSGSPVSTRQLFQTQTPSMLRSNLNNLRQGMSLQSRSTPEACSAYSESQVESLISDVQLHADLDIPKSRLCELSSLAAVASQYLRAHLQPGVFEFFYGRFAPSSRSTARVRSIRLTIPSLTDAAKHFFEDCMQAPPPHLVPLKVCATLALANILSKSFMAFVYIGKEQAL
jgi:hypothetical protein